MDRVPVEFVLHMNADAESLNEVDVDETAIHPLENFIEEQQLGVGASELAKATPAYKPPTDWTITHPRVVSQPIEARNELAKFADAKDLVYVTRRDETTGTVWREGRDKSGALKSARIVME